MMAFSSFARHALLGCAASATLALAACGTSAATAPVPDGGAAAAPGAMAPMPSPSTAAPDAAPVAADHIAIRGFAFGPASIRVKAGTVVTWTQQDEDQHTVTADDASFGSAPLTTGQTFTHAFTAPGTYRYHCSIHPFMHGTVVVTNG
jgi:plastocyanin